MGDAYSGRSLYFAKTGQYKHAIEDVRLAYINGVPLNQHKLLQYRLSRLRKDVPNQKKHDDEYIFKLSYDAHVNIPGVADCLELDVNDEFGHHIVTNRKLLAGDVIAIEEFFFNVVNVLDENKSGRYFLYCAYCLNSGYDLHLFPCGGCQHTMYCSAECQDNANAEYHNMECGLFETVVSSTCVIPIRFFFRALGICNGNIDELQKLTQQTDAKKDRFDQMYTDDRLQQTQRIVAAAYGSNRLVPNDPEYTEKRLAVIEIWLRDYSKTADLMNTHGTFIMEFITRMINVVASHLMSFNKYNPFMGTNAYPSECVAYAPFTSLVNHSCAENVACIRQNKRIILIVNQKIEAGEQIFINYG